MGKFVAEKLVGVLAHHGAGESRGKRQRLLEALLLFFFHNGSSFQVTLRPPCNFFNWTSVGLWSRVRTPVLAGNSACCRSVNIFPNNQRFKRRPEGGLPLQI